MGSAKRVQPHPSSSVGSLRDGRGRLSSDPHLAGQIRDLQKQIGSVFFRQERTEEISTSLPLVRGRGCSNKVNTVVTGHGDQKLRERHRKACSGWA